MYNLDYKYEITSVNSHIIKGIADIDFDFSLCYEYEYMHE